MKQSFISAWNLQNKLQLLGNNTTYMEMIGKELMMTEMNDKEL